MQAKLHDHPLSHRFDEGMYDVKVYFPGNGQLGSPSDDDSYINLWNRGTGITVSSVKFHPMYDHDNFHYDIAVLQMASAPAGITAVNLPTAGSKYIYS